MRCIKHTFCLSNFLLLFLLSPSIDSAAVKDTFETPLSARVPRDNKYYSSRYGSSSSNVNPLNRAIKPEESPEAREATQTPVEKRCTRCDSAYSDSRYPYESRTRYDDRRYDRYDDRYERRPTYDRYDDRRYDRYDERYDRRPTYDRYDRDRYDRDRYDRYDKFYDREPPVPGYDRDRYDRYDRDRYGDKDYERGFGYDNRGYDYRVRGYGDYDSFPSWGGSRGYGSSGGGRPDPGYLNAGGGYASNWNYGGGGRDDYRDSYTKPVPSPTESSSRYSGYYNRPRDPYEGYRSTSYLYERPSSTTTNRPSNSGDSDSGATQSPAENSSG